jgi:hypothetical protein
MPGAPMKVKKEQRAQVGVVACAVQDGSTTRLVFDDARSERDEFPQTWLAEAFSSDAQFDSGRFDTARLTERQFAAIGQALVARLGALKKGRGA